VASPEPAAPSGAQAAPAPPEQDAHATSAATTHEHSDHEILSADAIG
jgi:hypothetical protein